MRIIKIIASAGAALLASTALAHADPISISILGLLGIKAAAGSFLVSALTFFLTSAVQIGLSLIKAALNKPKKPGVSFEVEIGDDSPIGFVTGRYATPGTRKYINTWGKVGKTPNAYLVDVIQYGDLPSYGVPGLWVGGKKVTLLTAEPHAEFGYPVQEYRNTNNADFLWVKVKDGTQTVADPYLLAKFGAHATMPWLADMIGIGCPHLIITARFEPKMHRSGAPQVLIEPPPHRWYDLRKDSTVGGSGAHRWNDPSTWEPTVNLITQTYNIIRGVYYGDEWVFGGQNLSAYRLPASNWMAAMNEADVSTIAVGEEEEPQFRGGYEIRGDMEPLSVIEEFLKGSSSRLAEVGGRFKILTGAPGAAVFSFDDGGIVVTREQGFRPFPRLDETINAIEATYPEPGEMWAQKDAPPRYSNDLEVEDAGFRLATGIQFNAVSYGVQVQRLMETMLAEERRFRVHTLYLPPEAYTIEPLDVVSWSSARNGYTNKKFLVGRANGEPGMNQLVVLKEIDPSDYGGGGDYIPIDPQPPGVLEPPVQALPTFDAEGYAILDANGVPRRPSVIISFPGDLEDVRAVEVEVRNPGAALNLYNYNIPYGEVGADDSIRQRVLNGTFAPNVALEVRGTLVPKSEREVTPSDWIPVVTPNIGAGLIDLDPDVKDLYQWLGQGSRDLRDELRALAVSVSSLSLSNFDKLQTIRRETSSAYENLTAAYREEIVGATGPGSALSARMEAFSAKLGETASAGALNVALSRVTQTENGLALQSSMLSQVNLDLAGKASNNALVLIDVRLTETEGDVAAISTVLLDAQAALGTKNRTFSQTTPPTATAIGDLWIDTDDGNRIYRASAIGSGSWVPLPDQNRNRTFAQTSAPTAEAIGDIWIDTDNNNEISRWNGSTWVPLVDPRTATNAAATFALTARVSDVEGDTASLADALLAVDAEVGQFSASGRFRVTSEATPAGAVSRIGISTSATGGSGTVAAAIFLDAIAGGLSRVIINADRFFVTNTAGTVVSTVLQIVGGVTYLTNVNIENAIIGNLLIDGENIVANAITTRVVATGADYVIPPVDLLPGLSANPSFANSSLRPWYNILSAAITAVNAGRTLIQVTFQAFPVSTTGYSDDLIFLRLMRGTTIVKEWLGKPAIDFPSVGIGLRVSGYGSIFSFAVVDTGAPAGASTYHLQGISGSRDNHVKAVDPVMILTESKK